MDGKDTISNAQMRDSVSFMQLQEESSLGLYQFPQPEVPAGGHGLGASLCSSQQNLRLLESEPLWSQEKKAGASEQAQVTGQRASWSRKTCFLRRVFST